jgi:flavin-binding protein dodecin
VEIVDICRPETRFREEIAMAAVQTAAVVKVEEFVGSSPTSFSDAVRNVVRRASQTLRNIRGVEVISSNAEVGSDGELTLYKVNCKVAFIVEDH